MLFTRQENDDLNAARGIINAVLLTVYFGAVAVGLWVWLR